MSLLMGPDTMVASRARARSGPVTPRRLTAPELDNPTLSQPTLRWCNSTCALS